MCSGRVPIGKDEVLELSGAGGTNETKTDFRKPMEVEWKLRLVFVLAAKDVFPNFVILQRILEAWLASFPVQIEGCPYSLLPQRWLGKPLFLVPATIPNVDLKKVMFGKGGTFYFKREFRCFPFAFETDNPSSRINETSNEHPLSSFPSCFLIYLSVEFFCRNHVATISIDAEKKLMGK